MKASLFCAIVSLASASSPILGEQSLDSMQKMEASGDPMGARTALARAAQASPNSVAAWTAYAEFLDRYGDPAAREAYGHLLATLRASGDSARAATVAHRVELLTVLAADRAPRGIVAAPGTPPGTADIPGPLRSFARMAALPPDADPDRRSGVAAGR